MSFGQTIPVTGLNLGFLGQGSRTDNGPIVARQCLSTATVGPNFGDPMVIISDSAGGTWQSVANFIAQGGTFTAALFAAIAERNVKTQLSYISLGNNGTPQIGGYAPGQIGEGRELGTTVVQINNGTPTQGAKVFIRIVLNGAIPAGVVGGFEAVADGSNTVQIPNVVFRTGVLDANSCAEVTILTRTGA